MLFPPVTLRFALILRLLWVQIAFSPAPAQPGQPWVPAASSCASCPFGGHWVRVGWGIRRGRGRGRGWRRLRAAGEARRRAGDSRDTGQWDGCGPARWVSGCRAASFLRPLRITVSSCCVFELPPSPCPLSSLVLLCQPLDVESCFLSVSGTIRLTFPLLPSLSAPVWPSCGSHC